MSRQPRSLQRRQLLGIAAALAAPIESPRGQGCPQPTPLPKAGSFFVDVDDARLHCQLRGSGPLVLMLNGMWLDTVSNFFPAPFMNALARHFTVLTFDARGQGRSTAGHGAITYGRFASDAVRVMDHFGIETAHFVGHSDGGCIQLRLLIDFPDRMKTSTLIGTSYSQDSYSTKTRALFTEWFEQMRRGEKVQMTERRKEAAEHYAVVSPHPERFQEMLEAQRKCYATEPNIGLRELAGISRPVLVIAAGRDEHIPFEQFKVLADSIPGARRIDFPDMTHDIQPYVADIALAVRRFHQEVE